MTEATDAAVAALRALVAVEPYAYDSTGRYCLCCGRTEWHREEHADDCPWLRARAALAAVDALREQNGRTA